MSTVRNVRRLPHSIRKYIRQQKATLRRNLTPSEAQRAVEQLVRRFRSGGSPPAA